MQAIVCFLVVADARVLLHDGRRDCGEIVSSFVLRVRGVRRRVGPKHARGIVIVERVGLIQVLRGGEL